jgi:hypothetical protein
MRVVVPWGGQPWRYTTSEPPPDWQQPDFGDASWSLGLGGFGMPGTPGAQIGTEWLTPDIWLRRTIDVPPAELPGSPAFVAHHDEDLEVYLNGTRAASATGFLADYELLPLTLEGREALRPGRNVLAVHCRQTIGGQYVDVGIIDLGAPSTDPTAAFSLKSDAIFDPQSLRRWPESYLNLANRRFVNWMNAQSEPSLQPPYSAGAARSPLIDLLRSGHGSTALAPSELHTIATWIDLCIPCFGDYRATLDPEPLARYNHFLAKRKAWETP